MTEDKMVGWHHRLNGHEFEQTLGDSDKEAWSAAVHGVAQSPTRLSDFTFTLQFHALEKEMATHSSILAQEIPWMEEPGGLQSPGSQPFGYDLVTK